MAEYAIVKWALAHWRALALGAVLLALAGWHFQDKFSDWWDARKIARLESQVTALSATVEAQGRQIAQQEAATKAAQAARNRNDNVLPPARAEAAGRVSRAPTADDAQRLQDVAAALDADRAAASELRGKSASGANPRG